MNERTLDVPIQGALVDIDGTVVRSSAPVPGAREGIEGLLDRGIDVLYVSNTSSNSREECARRLENGGLHAGTDDIITAASATAGYLASNGFEDVYLVGSRPFADECRMAGVSVTDDPERATALVVGSDRQFDYETLTDALHALDEETTFVVTNLDRTTPVEGGERPGTGAIVGAVRGTTGRQPDVVVGKPSEFLARMALERLQLTAEVCVVIGDSIETDIVMGARAGMTTVLVLTGVSTRADLETATSEPDYVVDSLASVPRLLDRHGNPGGAP